MIPKTLSRAPLAAGVMLGTLGTLIFGVGDGARAFSAGHPTTPAVVLPNVQQPVSPSFGEAPPRPRTVAHVPKSSRHMARTGSRSPGVVTIHRVLRPRSGGPSSWALLNQAIARIPGYRPGVATWVVTTRYGRWGATDLRNGSISISPYVPASRVYAVASHEYGHARAAYDYGWNQQAADAALGAWFGGGTAAARERSADCMAIAEGATWTNYTPCQNEHWRQGAVILLAGQRLP
jgi:hypothetical protein